MLLVITRGDPADVAALAAAVVLSAVVLVGIGLLCAGLFKTQQQVNTWSGVILLALLAPAFTIGMPTPDAVNLALAFLPTAQTLPPDRQRLRRPHAVSPRVALLRACFWRGGSASTGSSGGGCRGRKMRER